MKPLLIHIHVPKCAGTTIEQHLMDQLGPKGFWMPTKRTASLPLELFGRKYRLSGALEGEHIAAVSGHYAGRSLQQQFAGRRIYRTMLLRDPESLMISWYNFRMTRYLAAGQRAYSFATHMRALPADPVANFLLDRWLELPYAKIAAMRHDEKCRRLEEALSGMDFIGDMSDCDRLVAWFGERLEIATQAARVNTFEQRNRAGGWRKIALEDLEPAILDELRDRTRLDRWLWQRWALGQHQLEAPAQSCGFIRSELRRGATEVMRKLARGKATAVRPAKMADPSVDARIVPGE